MARIKKDEHVRILHLVDVERRPVREVAAEYGCTAAAIYGILAKCRRAGGAVPAADGEETAETPPTVMPVGQPDLALEPVAPPASPVVVQPAEPAPPAAAPVAVPAPVIPLAAVEKSPARQAPPLGARLARPGMGLVMRGEDGEETVTPFRSIDDLLSAIKPILRATARSPEPVWFSLRPVDLSAIEMDAA